MTDLELWKCLAESWRALTAFRHGEHGDQVQDLQAHLVRLMEELEDEVG
jgi:hypothetical protein